jgi:SAM-dependent methyltransferase
MNAAYNTNNISNRRKLKIDQHFSKSSESYLADSHRLPWSVIRKIELDAVKSLIFPHPGASVLEVGSGAGFYFSNLSKLFSLWKNVEPNEDMYFAAINAGVPTFHGTLKDFLNQNSDTKFDRILLAGVLEFSSDIDEGRQLCLELKSVLEKDGKIVILSPRDGVLGSIYLLCKRKLGCPTISRNCLVDIKSVLGRPKRTIKHLFSQTQVWHE